MNGWWYRASLEQRLAQVDAGIELGLTAQHIAMASEASSGAAVRAFGREHGRAFVGRTTGRTGLRTAMKHSRNAAYFRGEPVDLWREGVQDRSIRRDDDLAEVILE